MKLKFLIIYSSLFIAVVLFCPLESCARTKPLNAKETERFLQFYQSLRDNVDKSPSLVDPKSVVNDLRKRLHYHHPGIISYCRDGYNWRVFSQSLVVKPIANDNWEISTKDAQLALVHPNDVKLFVFEKDDMMNALPEKLSGDTAILLFAKRYVIVIEPFHGLYADLSWSWRNPYPSAAGN